MKGQIQRPAQSMCIIKLGKHCDHYQHINLDEKVGFESKVSWDKQMTKLEKWDGSSSITVKLFLSDNKQIK